MEKDQEMSIIKSATEMSGDISVIGLKNRVSEPSSSIGRAAIQIVTPGSQNRRKESPTYSRRTRVVDLKLLSEIRSDP